jgi:hypothetical protein
MGPDRKKQFLKKNPDLIPSDEEVLGVVIAEAKGGAWRRGIAAGVESVSQLGSAAMDAAESLRSREPDVAAGDAARWPDSAIFWVAITNKQLHAFEGRVNSQEAGPGAAHYQLDRIAEMRFEKKLLISKLSVSFRDGSSLELDISKQNVKPFVEAIEARSASA